MEHGESFDPAEQIQFDEAQEQESNRVYFAKKVETLQKRERELSSELASVVQELENARTESARAGEPRWNRSNG